MRIRTHAVRTPETRSSSSASAESAQSSIGTFITITLINRIVNQVFTYPRNHSRPLRTTLLMDLLDKASPLLEFEPSIFKIMVKEIVVYPEKFRFYLNNNLALDEGRCLR